MCREFYEKYLVAKIEIEADERMRAKIGSSLFKYTVCFIGIVCLIYAFFSSANRSFVFRDDAMQQHFVALKYMRNYIMRFISNLLNGKFILPAYDLSIGQGADIFITLSYYGFTNPIYWIVAAFPENSIETAYAVIYFIQLYLSGCSFLFLTRKMNIKKAHTWIAAIMYTFTTYSLCYALRHPFFLTGMIYLPLMIVYAREVLIAKKGERFLAVWTAICICANFYFGYINIILVSLFTCTYCLSAENKRLMAKRLIIVLMYLLIGVFLASPILFSIIKAYFNTYRASGCYNLNIFYSADTYMDYLQRAFLLSASGGKNETALGVAGVSLASLFAVYEKENLDIKTIRRLILAMFIMIMFPIFGFVLNGCSYAINRWCYGFLLMLCINVAFSDLKKIHGRQIWVLFLIPCIMCIVIWLYKGAWSRQATLLLITEVMIGVMPSLVSKQKWFRIYNFNFICIFLICVNIYLVMPSFTEAFNENKVLDSVNYSVEYPLSGKNIFRSSKIEEGDTADINSSLLTGDYGISTYWSILQGNLTSYYLDFDLCSMITPQTLSTFGLSLPLNTLSSVRYILSDLDEIPMYGFKKVSDNIFENNFALPIGYVYTSVVSEENYSSMNPVEKMECLMQAIVLKNEISNTQKVDNKGKNIITNVDKFTICDIEMFDIERNENIYTAHPGSSILISYTAKEYYDAYLYIKNIKNVGGEDSASISLNSYDIIEDARIKNNKNFYYFERDNVLFPLGTLKEDGVCQCTLSFSSDVSFTMDSIEIMGYSVSHYEDWIGELQNSVLKNTIFKEDQLTGNIDCKDNGYLMINIPYSEGWRGYIDDKAVEVEKANHLYMAVPISRGYHEIRFVYYTPGKNEGIILGIIGLILLVFVPFVGKQYFIIQRNQKY